MYESFSTLGAHTTPPGRGRRPAGKGRASRGLRIREGSFDAVTSCQSDWTAATEVDSLLGAMLRRPARSHATLPTPGTRRPHMDARSAILPLDDRRRHDIRGDNRRR